MVSSNTSVDFIDFPYRHVAVSPHQQALRLAQSLANGGTLDYYLIGRLDNHVRTARGSYVKDSFITTLPTKMNMPKPHPIAEVLLLKGEGKPSGVPGLVSGVGERAHPARRCTPRCRS